MKFEQELRLASDETLHRLDRLRELELEKRTLTPGTERFVELAREVESLAESLLAATTEQERLAEASAVVQQQTPLPVRPIEAIAPRRDIAVILNEWRDAERRLGAAGGGTPDHEEARADVERLRREYRDAYKTASDNGQSARPG